MKSLHPVLRALAGALAFAAALLAWPTQARADAFGTLITIVQKMESAGVSPFPVKSGEIQAAQGLFNCIKQDASAKGVTNCLYNFSQTPQGKKLLGSGATIELPPWLEQVIQAYVHIQEGDFWGVIGDLGEAAICIVAQVMAAGFDVCGLIKDLIAVGEALLDAGKAVAKFLASIGGGVADTVKSVGCSLGLGGCGSAPPPEKVAYVCAFAPHVKPSGLSNIEAVDPFAFPKLRDSLVAKAKSGVPCPAYMNSNYKASAGAANKAAEIFTGTVEGVWTGDILAKVLAQRDKKRVEYPTAAQLAILGSAATAEYDAKKSNPVEIILKRCAVDDFGIGFGFAHVDRWLLWRQPGNTKAQQDALKVPNVSSNREWCQAQVFAKNVAKFAQQFRTFAKNKYCPEFGQQLACQILDKYHACVGLMKSVGQAAQCQVNAASLGKELAGKVAEYFASKKTQYPCQILQPAGQSVIGNKPVVYACTRATHKHFCELKYKSLWTGPPQVLDCAVPKLDPAYAALAAKVALAVKDLQAKYPGIGVDAVDPLMVHSGSDANFAALKKAAGFRTAAPVAADAVSFSYVLSGQLTIDGFSRPTIVADFEQKPLQVGAPASIAESIAPVKPGDPDPFAKPAGSPLVGAAALAAGAGLGAAGGPTTPLSGPLPGFTSGLRAPGQEPGSVAPLQLPSALQAGGDHPGAYRSPVSGLRAPATVAAPAIAPQRSSPPVVRAPPAPAASEARVPAVQAPPAPAASAARVPAVQAPSAPAASAARVPAVQAPPAPVAPAARVPAVQPPPAPATGRESACGTGAGRHGPQRPSRCLRLRRVRLPLPRVPLPTGPRSGRPGCSRRHRLPRRSVPRPPQWSLRRTPPPSSVNWRPPLALRRVRRCVSRARRAPASIAARRCENSGGWRNAA